MSWTYDLTALGSSSRSWVRMRIADTTSGDQQLQDEEIDALISQAGNKELAAVLCCETLGAKYARQADKTVGKLSISAGKISENYFKLAKTLRNQMNISVMPYAGGISQADKNANENDNDRPTPDFSRDQFSSIQLAQPTSSKWLG